LDHTLSQDDKQAVELANAWHDTMGKQLEKERGRRGLPDVSSLAAIPEWIDRYAKWKKLDDQHAALVTAEQALRCEGWLLDKDTDGSFTWRTGNAVEMFQRRNFLMPTERLDSDTRDALQVDSRELDFRLALRVLRERVVDATA